MKVQELIRELEGFDPEAEVRLAIQPSYPFQHSIDAVAEDSGHEHTPVFYEDEGWVCEDPNCQMEFGAEEPHTTDLVADVKETIVYIAEGGQIYDAPYLPGSARQALGWGR